MPTEVGKGASRLNKLAGLRFSLWAASSARLCQIASMEQRVRSSPLVWTLGSVMERLFVKLI